MNALQGRDRFPDEALAELLHVCTNWLHWTSGSIENEANEKSRMSTTNFSFTSKIIAIVVSKCERQKVNDQIIVFVLDSLIVVHVNERLMGESPLQPFILYCCKIKWITVKWIMVKWMMVKWMTVFVGLKGETPLSQSFYHQSRYYHSHYIAAK